MKISIGSDHRGHDQRKTLVDILESLGHQAVDCGSFGEESADYPDIAQVVCKNVLDGNSERAILVCGTGIGMSIAANKIDGIRAALVCSPEAATLSTQHNNANLICLAGNDYQPEHYRNVVTAWLEAEFEGGRHQRRLDKVADLEDK